MSALTYLLHLFAVRAVFVLNHLKPDDFWSRVEIRYVKASSNYSQLLGVVQGNVAYANAGF